jgi:hypothetical protein
MRVVVGSIFRNSAGYVDRYQAQVRALAHLLQSGGDTLRLVLVEGVSTDDTWDRLSRWAEAGTEAVTLVKREHGGPAFGSVENGQRWAQIAYACNGVLEGLTEADDALVYVESDLIWHPSVMRSLLWHLEIDGVATVSPLSMHQAGFFYDTWGYRSGGQRFGHHPPYHPMLAGPAPHPAGLYPLDSAGSCIVTLGEAARRTRFAEPEGIVTWCDTLRAAGFPHWLDPSLQVTHP